MDSYVSYPPVRRAPQTPFAPPAPYMRPAPYVQPADKIALGLTESGNPFDPRRMGLSGSGTRAYMRLLKQGLDPDEARRRVDEMRFNRRQQSAPFNANVPEENREAQTESIKVAIMAKDHPQRVLTTEELSQLEQVIEEEILADKLTRVRCEGFRFHDGIVMVDCADKNTSRWLNYHIPLLKTWQGPLLVTRWGKHLPVENVITVCFPRSATKIPSQLLSVVAAQNEGLCTEKWVVHECLTEGDSKTLKIVIDDVSRTAIEACDHRIFFRLGRIPVEGLRRKDPPVENV